MNESEAREGNTNYNQIAGESVERLAAISDGIFAVAMTLLVLDLHEPARELIHSEQDLWRSLAGMFPQFIAYLLSFLTLAIFWNGQQAQLNRFTRTNRHLTWIHMAFLFAVSIMPFSTRLLAHFINYSSKSVPTMALVPRRSCQQFPSTGTPPQTAAGTVCFADTWS